MSLFQRDARRDMASEEDLLMLDARTPPTAQGFGEIANPIKWELDPTPEALYQRINEISTLFSLGKYTKLLAVQRMLDLIYDIDSLPASALFSKTARSRYYLLIFNYIFQIRSARFRLPDFRQRKTLAEMLRRSLTMSDQMMYIKGIDFSEMSLPSLRISQALFKDCSFINANLRDLSFTGCQFIQCRFDSANLTASEITNCSLEGVTLTDSNLSGARILRSSLVGCDFCEIISSRGQLPLRANGCDFVACSFRQADLRGADFRNSRMTGCDTLDAKKDNARGVA